MRDLIPIRNVFVELSRLLQFKINIPLIHSTVFEDNNGTLEFAKETKYRLRAKHIVIKNFSVKNKTIRIEKINTKEQLADIFTKPLDKLQFEALRKTLIGW